MGRRRLPLLPVGLAFLALAVLLSPGATSTHDRGAPAPPSDTTLALPGLSGPVRIVTDRHGIPHLHAGSLDDLYLAWGFVTARDRLWQLLATRQAVRGQMWRWAGNATLQDDGGAQLFEFPALARSIWARAGRDPAAARPVGRYCAGINAYLALCRSGAAPWPPEVERLHITPADWTPEDVAGAVVGMGSLLDLAFPQLDERGQLARLGPEGFRQRRRFEDRWTYETIPDSAARRLYGSRAAAATRLVPAAPTACVSPALLAAARRSVGPRAGEIGPETLETEPGSLGSNVFAAGPRRSASGMPLFANDPHLGLTTPGPFHLIHVTVPGLLDAAGACVPGLPAIWSGRNADCAWGATSFSSVVADVYADSLSADGRSVLTGGRWVRLREEPFDMDYTILGMKLPVRLLGRSRQYTPHGPVLAVDRRARIALSARWAGATDRVDLGRLIGIERARSAAQVCAAFQALATPTLNVVAADRSGRVRYQSVGQVPWRGFRLPPGPLPGDGRWEWKGVIPAARMPAWDVPAAGIVVNANNRPVGEPYFEPLPGYELAQDRALRIAERLAGDPRLTAADFASVQNDVHSRLARRVLPLLLACADSLVDSLGTRERAALDTLRGWDLTARRRLVAPTLWRAWYGAFLRRSQFEGRPGLAWAALSGLAPGALPAPGVATVERPATAAVAALRLGIAKLDSLLGPNMGRWQYGRAHRARLRHGLGRLLGFPGWDAPPAPVDGDTGTPCVGSSRLPWQPWVSAGPVFRHVVDLAVRDSSLAVLPPGNAGDPRSPHARDLLRTWQLHGYVPLYLSWERIETAKESELRLTPASR